MTTELPQNTWHRSNWSVPPQHSSQPRWRQALAVIAIFIIWNIAANVATIPDGGDFIVSIIGLGAMIWIARKAGVSWDYLGLNPRSLPKGIRIGLVGAGVVVLGVIVATALPFSREFFADDRFVGVTTAEMLYETLIRIPLGTSLAEELAFRGVLLGMLLLWLTPLRAVIVSSALFGLWHILPGFAALDTNPAGDVAGGTGGEVAGVAVQVAVTGIAGAVFAWTRLRGNSLATPVIIHWGLNAAAYVAGWLVVRNAWA